jgi:hypothetical protein
MEMTWNIARALMIAVIVLAVAELSKRYPRYGALLLSLPLMSILAILASWFQHHDVVAMSRLAKETLILVPLGLCFFVPLAFAPRLGFWASFGLGILLLLVVLGTWLKIAPPN